MKLFVERLKELGAFIIALVLLITLWIGFVLLLAHFPTFVGSIVVGVLAILAIFVIIGFINWLFVEPFRKGRAK